MTTRRGQVGADDTLAAIGDAIDGARDAPRLADEGDLRPFGGVDDDDEFDAPPLPPDCPVTCLGKLGQTCFYLDVTGEIVPLAMGNGHGKNAVIGLFGVKAGWLEANFPQWSKPKKERDPSNGQWVEVEPSQIIGYDQARASKALIIECTRRGIFDPAGRVRGAGAHRGEDDALILHCGDYLMRRRLRVSGDAREIEWAAPGLHGDHVYPAAGAIPRPWPEAVPELAGMQALEHLRRWYWKRPKLDPLLMLGGIGASLIGGALDWRSNIWITGGKGTGKSTLNGKRGFLDLMIGKGSVRAADVSAAYLRQRLRNATLPVFLDEREAGVDNRHNEQILTLARISSSGDDAGRGGQDHVAAEFTLSSAFWASSILVPPMEPQDRSRWAICQLMPIPQGAKRLDIKALRLPELGQQLLRRMVDGWARWEVTLAAYVDALSDLGHSARACDQFGTLLAAADLLMNDKLPSIEEIDMTAALCGKDMLREVTETAEEHELCLNHLRTSMVQSRGGDERESIGTWVGGALQEICAPAGVSDKYHKRLQEIGLKIVQKTEKGTAVWLPGKRGYLAVANSHQALAALFGHTKWTGGVWTQALGYTPDAIAVQGVKFQHHTARAMLVPLELVIDESEIPKDARWTQDDLGMPQS